jgi:hypothetical protein
MSVDSALSKLFKKAVVYPNLPIVNNEDADVKCSNYFGYLAENIKENLPEECLLCPKLVDCILLPLGAMSNPFLKRVLSNNQFH